MGDLIPIEQRQVEFYEDEITAVIVDVAGYNGPYVPLRPICEAMGLDWSAQSRRIGRDPVLSEVSISVAVMATDIDPESRRPRASTMLCLPLDKLDDMGIEPQHQRIGPLAVERALGYGQLVILKRGWPDLFNRFASAYPEARAYV